MRGASVDTAEPIIVAVIAVSSWIRSSRERARDPADTLAAEGELRFAIFDISLVLVCTGLYVLRFGSFACYRYTSSDRNL